MSISYFSIRGRWMRGKAVFMKVRPPAADSPLVCSHCPAFEVAGGAEEGYLAAFEFEGYVLQCDEAFAGLDLGAVEIVEVGGGGVHFSADGFDIFVGDLVLE